jgi:hypothetical protein
MSTLLDDLADMFPDTVAWRKALAIDGRGKVTSWQASQDLPAYVYGKTSLIRDSRGQERVSTVRIVIRGAYGCEAVDEFTLPSRFTPRKPRALAVARRTDEAGAHHETVFFE